MLLLLLALRWFVDTNGIRLTAILADNTARHWRGALARINGGQRNITGVTPRYEQHAGYRRYNSNDGDNGDTSVMLVYYRRQNGEPYVNSIG